MPPAHPFLEEDGEIDTDRVLAEAVPIVKLLAMVVVLAFVPLVLGLVVLVPFEVFGLEASSSVERILVLLAQFVLAAGGAVVLLYVVSRAIQIADT